MDSSLNMGKVEPKKEQWALINNQQAYEYKRMKQIEKMANKQRKQQFRMELDQQLDGKSSFAKNEREEDKKYSDYIKNRERELALKDHQQKINKIMSRRRIQEENQHRLEQSKTSSRIFRNSPEVHTGLDIGRRDQNARAQKQNKIRRQLVDSLDQQLQMKESQRQIQKMNQNAIIQANHNYQRMLDQRSKRNHRYTQNQRVYSYYDSLNQQRIDKQKDLQKRYIEEASIRNKEKQMRKQQETKRRKNMLNDQIKMTLDDQVRYHSQQALQNKRSNPEDHSYSVIGNMFREKNSPYDKKEYSEYLKRQADQQNSRKRKWNFMNEQEYRFNMNQLKKAVEGNYAHDQYIDRSVNMIGLPKTIPTNLQQQIKPLPEQNQNDPDSVAVKHKIHQLYETSNGHMRASASLDVSGVRKHSYEPPVKIN